MGREKEHEIKLKGIMEYYIKQYFEEFGDKCKAEMSKFNPGIIDPEMLDIQIDQYIEVITQEATEKFHSIAYLILNCITNGQEPLVREFEILFIDLVKRTLIPQVKAEKEVPISIVIADPNVSGTEE